MNLALQQTTALFVDAYRELNARRLFWITLALSMLVVVGFAAIGVKDGRVTFLVWSLDLPLTGAMSQPATFYKSLFVAFGIGFWLAWIATILALVSSASIFPEFLSSGAIELVLSKPLSRTRLFLTKYATGLLFSAVQVGAFSLACFILIGVRGGTWEPRLFLAIPIVAAIFSFLYCVCVLLGVMTRSTIASLLLTLLFWFFVFLVNAADGTITQLSTMNEVGREKLPARIVQWEKTAANLYETGVKAERARAIQEAIDKAESTDGLVLPESPIPVPTKEQLDASYNRLPKARRDLVSLEASASNWRIANQVVEVLKFSLPKTQETSGLLIRSLLEPGSWSHHDDKNELADAARGLLVGDMREVEKRVEAKQRSKPLWWILGTSFAFEGVVLCIAGWLFARKEF